jgi:competence protein ComEC
VGDQRAIDRADWDVFRATGVAHLMSISGLHITMFAWIAALLVGALWRRSIRLCTVLPAPVAALWGGLLLAVLYAVFSGWGLPAQRTCLMLAAVAVLRVSGARWPWPQVWMLACAVVVACDPWALLQAGFWLSFVAVAVLFATSQPPPTDPVAQDPLSNGAALGDGFTPEHAIGEGALNPAVLRAMERLWRMVQEQWTITLALAPLTALLFGQVSLIGLVANLVAIPWVTLVVTPLAMLGVVVPDAKSLAVPAIDLLMAGLNGFAALPLPSVVFAAVPVWAGALGVLGAVVLVASLPWPVRGLGVPLLLPVLLWQAPLPATGHFELLAADIGQGNAVLVRTATHALLYDAGPRYSFESDAGHRVLVPLLQALQTQLDLVLLSHRDTDHVGGAAAVLAMQVDAQLVSSIREDHPLQTLRSARRCVAGQTWSWDGVQFEILHPRAADYPEPGAPDPKPNSVSCVLRVTNGAQTALLVGDIEAPQEDALLGRGAPLRADVLLVPHHGSKTSSSAAFLDAVRPRFGLVQAGYRNRFGHPAPDVAQRYADRRIEVHDSPHCGAMTWHSAQPLRVECTRMMQMHYWSHRVP